MPAGYFMWSKVANVAGRKTIALLQFQQKRFVKNIAVLGKHHHEPKYSRRSAENFDSLGSWNHRIELQLNVEQSIKLGKLIPNINIGHAGGCSLTGRRKENEDRIAMVEISPQLLLIGIFDGHGGAYASQYVSEHCEDIIKLKMENGETDLQKILKETFHDVNGALRSYMYHNYEGQDCAMNAGTTATICLLRNSVELVVGHVGDSRALICRKGRAIPLTTDHKPELEEEEARIKEKGGKITWSSHGRPRVNGRLDMTRSIGDFDLKRYGVIADPDTRSIEVKHHKDSFLVLTTDGVTFVLTDQEVADLISHCRDPQEAAQFVADQALHFGSDDNVSAVVVPFGSWGKFSSRKIHISFGRNITGRRYEG